MQISNLKHQKPPTYKCSRCRDTGWIETTKNNFTPCICIKKDQAKKQFERTGLNIEHSKQTLENFKVVSQETKVAKATAEQYLKDYEKIKHSRTNSIMLGGQVGSGKTHISIAIAIKLLRKGVSVVYMPYRDTITKIKQNMLDKEYYKRELSKYQNAEILLIDDLYKGKITEADINIMFEIVNHRYLNYLPIIISSEFEITRLLNFDEAVGSRIYEMCKDYTVQIKKDINNNYRLK